MSDASSPFQSLVISGKSSFRAADVQQESKQTEMGTRDAAAFSSTAACTSSDSAPSLSLAGVKASFAIHDSPFPPNIFAWVGGAISASLEGLATRSISRDDYLTGTPLPSWAASKAEEDYEPPNPGA